MGAQRKLNSALFLLKTTKIFARSTMGHQPSTPLSQESLKNGKPCKTPMAEPNQGSQFFRWKNQRRPPQPCTPSNTKCFISCNKYTIQNTTDTKWAIPIKKEAKQEHQIYQSKQQARYLNFKKCANQNTENAIPIKKG